jgi:hypothetical protein
VKLPPYKKRTKRQLKSALTWAQRKLGLENWDITLFVDKEMPDELRESVDVGGLLYRATLRSAWIGLDHQNAEGVDWDPLIPLFHELAHLALPPTTRSAELEEERAANVVSLLLYDLWSLERGKKKRKRRAK